jgi:putative acetyltransferase
MRSTTVGAHEIRRSRPEDGPALTALWERSVRATHGFIDDADIDAYRPVVAGLVNEPALDLWILTDASARMIGFLGVSPQAVEALFLDPTRRRRGWGRYLMAYAQNLLGGALTVEVNEENLDARRFYAALGFVVTGRTELDDMGRPHPLLRLRREAPASEERAG